MAGAGGSPVRIGPNDVLRLGLELGALAALGWWGYVTGSGPLRYGLAVGLPLVAAVVWGTFRVPDDPGAAPVAVAGPVRLAIEAALFATATAALVGVAGTAIAVGFAGTVVVHYAIAHQRLTGLLANRWPPSD